MNRLFSEFRTFRNTNFFGIPDIARYGTVRFLKFRFRTVFRNSAHLQTKISVTKISRIRKASAELAYYFSLIFARRTVRFKDFCCYSNHYMSYSNKCLRMLNANCLCFTEMLFFIFQSLSVATTPQVIVQPPAPKELRNKALLCKPFMQTKATSCRPHSITKGTQTGKYLS